MESDCLQDPRFVKHHPKRFYFEAPFMVNSGSWFCGRVKSLSKSLWKQLNVSNKADRASFAITIDQIGDAEG